MNDIDKLTHYATKALSIWWVQASIPLTIAASCLLYNSGTDWQNMLSDLLGYCYGIIGVIIVIAHFLPEPKGENNG